MFFSNKNGIWVLFLLGLHLFIDTSATNTCSSDGYMGKYRYKNYTCWSGKSSDCTLPPSSSSTCKLPELGIINEYQVGEYDCHDMGKYKRYCPGTFGQNHLVKTVTITGQTPSNFKSSPIAKTMQEDDGEIYDIISYSHAMVFEYDIQKDQCKVHILRYVNPSSSWDKNPVHELYAGIFLFIIVILGLCCLAANPVTASDLLILHLLNGNSRNSSSYSHR